MNVSDYDYGRGQEGDTEGYQGVDTALGTDAQSVPFVLAASADAALGADAQALTIAVQAVPSADTALGTDAQATGAPWQDSDAAAGTDAQQLLYSPASADAGTGAEQAVYVIEVFPFPPSWLFTSGGYRLVWRPGTPEERVIAHWPVAHRSDLAAMEELASRIRDSDTLLDVVDSDGGAGAGSCGPTVSVRQMVAPQAQIEVRAARHGEGGWHGQPSHRLP